MALRMKSKPAARLPAVRKKPASKSEELPVTHFHYLRELAAAQLRCLGLIELGDAHYYGGHHYTYLFLLPSSFALSVLSF